MTFFLYGTAAAVIFPQAFFPQDLPTMVVLIASFSTFAVGFLARPLGGAIFGHFGDRVGRKKTLVVALMMMGGGDHPDWLFADLSVDRRDGAAAAGGAAICSGSGDRRPVGRGHVAGDGERAEGSTGLVWRLCSGWCARRRHPRQPCFSGRERQLV